MKMRAAVLSEPKHALEIQTLDLADPGPGEVRVKVAASGVCASDLHVLDGKFPMALGMPIVPGHEAAGIVDEIGEGVTEVAPGDHVVITFYPGCGRCVACKTGTPFACKNVRMDRMPDGTTRLSRNGQPVYHYSNVSSFAEYLMVTERGCVKIPSDLPLDVACLIGCGVITGFAVVIRHTKVAIGSSAAVIGCGGVGLNVLQACHLAGATKIIAVDTSDFKLDMARQFGATHTVNATSEDPVKTVREMTNGLGVNYSFEVIGVPELIRQAYDLTAAGGTVTVVGVSPPGTEVSFPAIDFGNRKTVTWASGGAANPWRDFPIIADLYKGGRWKLDELVTRRRPLDEVNEAVADLRAGRVARSVLTM
jgi:S-(hydroxymethyl)glutathione dehydrogenase / alcohol dehydrogenase